MGVKDVQLISDKQWLAGIRDIIELHKYGRADEVRTVHRLASTCEERYQKALEYLEGKRGQQGEPAGASKGEEGERTAGGTCWSRQGGGRREDGRGNLLEQGKEGEKTAGGTCWRKGRRTAGKTCWRKQGGRRREDGRGNLLEQGGGGRREEGRGTWFSRPLAPPKVVTLGNPQINLVFLSLIRNFAP